MITKWRDPQYRRDFPLGTLGFSPEKSAGSSSLVVGADGVTKVQSSLTNELTSIGRKYRASTVTIMQRVMPIREDLICASKKVRDSS